MIAHFFDLDTILTFDSKVWVVDKKKPNIPLFKVSQSDFKLIKSGIFKNQNNPIQFSGITYWLESDMMSKIKIKAKNYNCDVSNLAFSMQEFMNKEIIENLDYQVSNDLLLKLKNTDNDIYIICSKNNKSNYEVIIKKIEDKLKEQGLNIKKYYFISDTFFNRDKDEISHKKVRLLLQHLVGYKTEGDKFYDEQLKCYNEIYYYDNEPKSIELANDCNTLFSYILSNSEKTIKESIKSEITENPKTLIVNNVSENKVNRVNSNSVQLKYRSVMTFESFRFKA